MDEIRELMFKSFEENLSPDEKILLDTRVNESEELKSELKDYKALRNKLGEIDYGYDDNFTGALIGRLHSNFDLFTCFKKIAFASAAAIIVLAGSAYLMDGSINIDSLFGLHSYPVEEEFYAMLNF